jgi:hypothetical protein
MHAIREKTGDLALVNASVVSPSSRPEALMKTLGYCSFLLATLAGTACVSESAPPPVGPVIVIGPGPGPDEPPRDNVEDTVQIALLLDTSSSMDGLINQARAHLWTMVDQIGQMTREVNGLTRGVKIELALYQYGNDTLSASSGYIQRVLPFTTDLDTVAEKLHALFTNGGSEFAGQVIETAVNQLAWSPNPDSLKFVFLAGNEEFDQGPISAERAMSAAAQKGINVQLIFAGSNDPTWERAARLAKSDLMTIDQNHVVQHVAAPQDDEIVKLGAELNATYMAYGADGAASSERQSKADFSSAKMGKKAAVERAQLKAKKDYRNDTWDVVDAVAKDGKFLDKAPDARLPAELRGKSLAEKQQIVTAKTAKRAELKAKLAKLEADRNAYVAAEQKKNAAKASKVNSLDSELMKSTRKAASAKGYK